MVARTGDDGSGPAPTATSAPTTGSTTTSTTQPVPVPVDLAALTVEPLPEDRPASYRIVYDIVENALERRETWAVRRPYESLIVSDRDDVLVSGSATSATQLYTYLLDRNAWFAIQPQLHRAAYDQHPLTAMATMIALGFAEVAGEAEYAGTPCSVFVTGAPLTSGSVAPPGDERTEVCIDGRGLVLHERWEIGGSLVSERTATSVEVDPDLDPAGFDPMPQIGDVAELDVLLSTVAVAADEETIARLRTDVVLPDAYTLDGTVFRTSASNAGTTGASETVRFYSDGADLIEVAEVTVGGPAELDGGGAVLVEVDGFEETWFDPDFRVSAIRTRMTDTSFVEIRGADPRQLVEILRSLTLR